MPLSRRSLCRAAAASLAVAPVGGRAQEGAPDSLGAILDTARGYEQLRCLVVARDGETLVEAVLRGPPADRPVNVKSVSKSVVAALTGAALDRGEIASLDATLGAVAPGLVPPDADPAVDGITLRDLITMRAGLERTSGAGYGAWVASRDWVADALGRPMVAEPGGRMLYSTGSSHVLGAVLAQVSGRSLLALARERLGDPLGIEIPPWVQDPQGRYMGGNQMALSPRGMLRFGELYRRGGLWEGTAVLPADWVADSLVARTRSPWSGLGYGYGWFIGRTDRGPVALARGYGGQVIATAPAEGMTVAITSDPSRPARSAGYFGALMGLVDRILALPA